jgi:peroxiredoxin
MPRGTTRHEEDDMSLREDLRDLERDRRSKRDPRLTAVLDAATDELRAARRAERALTVGDHAPDFTLDDARGGRFTLSDALQRGPVVLSFYRGGWCPYCSLELRALAAVLPEIEALGGTLVAVSPQTPDASLATAERLALPYAVLSDVGIVTARRYGLAFELPDALRAAYREMKIDVEGANGGEAALPIPATYVIAGDGTILAAAADPDYTFRLDPEDVLAALTRARPAARPG